MLVYGSFNMEVNPVSHGLLQQMGYFITDSWEVAAQSSGSLFFIYHF